MYFWFWGWSAPLKVHCVVLWNSILIWGKRLFFLCLNKWTRPTKQTDLKGQRNCILFHFVYMWRTLPFPSFKQCSGDLILLWEQLVYSVMENSLYYYLSDIVNIKIQSLNFFSKTTWSTFTSKWDRYSHLIRKWSQRSATCCCFAPDVIF